MEEEKLERSIRKSEIPGLTREEEEAQLAKVIGIAEQNLEQAKADIRSANEDLADLMETYDAKEAEGLALWNNATAKLNAYLGERLHDSGRNHGLRAGNLQRNAGRGSRC